ncbi:MAG: TetR family transcriptional regulator [Hyphomonas sp.]|uniref:TetR/AcrR family transcriptional regulator n=1 Tax=Hyphomonas sp. TaxID=87 RepID=UPI000C51699B|nr:TetR/AcrR family transcriptional regulator [Hyphomonas sp.]MBB39369.1 TetR family transcriptional regulator [Hyphomonas sp.]
MTETKTGQKRLRADAERNRQRLLQAAKEVFARDGASASLEEIARTAGVGIGTLYRQFPSRDTLVEDVYRNAVVQLGEAAGHLAETHAPLDAIREWLLLFVDYISTKRIMTEAITALGGSADTLYAGTGDIMRNALADLVRRAEAAGDIRPVADPFDLLRAVAGVLYVSPAADPQAESGARNVIDLLIAGLRKT